MLFFSLINVKMPTIVGILTFMSRKNPMLNRVEHKKSFITSRPDLVLEDFGDFFRLYCILRKNCCKQLVYSLIRRCVFQRLIRLFTKLGF